MALLLLLSLAVTAAPVRVGAEPLQVTRVAMGDDRLELEWVAEAGLDYFEVQTSRNLAPDEWLPVLRTGHRYAAIDRSALEGFVRIAAVPAPSVGTFTDARRGEILAEVAAVVAALPGDNAVTDASAVAAYLRGRPEFDHVGVISGSDVHAQFTDGRPLLILGNRPPALPSDFLEGVDVKFLSDEDAVFQDLPAPAPSPANDAPKGAPARLAAAKTVTGTGMPASRNALLFQANGMGIESPMLAYLAPAFQAAGYHVFAQETSLANFLAVEGLGDDVGVFYVDAHGGILRLHRQEEEPETGNILIRRIELYVLATSTTVTPETDAAYAATLFAGGEIGYVQLGSSVLKGLRFEVSPTYYFITPEFVRKRWRFSRNSFVYFDTCHSARDEATSFRDVCFANGASLYAGWTDSVHDAWAFKSTTPPLCDLLLGGSHIYPVEPPQRPFDLGVVLDYMERKGLLRDRTPGFPGARFQCWSGPPANGSFRLLNPSILGLGVESETTGQVRIGGRFDPEAPTTVRVEGQANAEITPLAVTSAAVTFPLPADQSPSAGQVAVIQRSRASNTIPLTEWTIPATLVKHYAPGTDQPSALMDFSLRFRADVHEARTRPFSKPVPLATGASIAPGTIGRVVSASGVYQFPNNQGTVEWRLDAPVDVPFQNLRGLLTIGADRTATLTASLLAGNVMTVVQKTGADELVYQREPGTGAFPPGETALDPATFRLRGGAGSAAGDAGTFEWEDALPLYPPTGDFAR